MTDDEGGSRGSHVPTVRDAEDAPGGLATLVAMGKCTNCGAALDPEWKFCIACGEPVPVTVEDGVAASREPIPSAIRPDEPDEPRSRKRPDVAVLVGVVMAVGGGVLIILVAIILFSPRA
jgi:uncharacterized OB-fold protein